MVKAQEQFVEIVVADRRPSTAGVEQLVVALVAGQELGELVRAKAG
jgi:hypothetical protein